MAKVALRAYVHEIESLIEQGQRLDEAVAHCRHVLATYPKHLDTYRLLGKANLEAKRHDQAVDIFQRVLVAAPEDFVSHVGMSIIADDQGKLDEAIWHMERAFEVQPSNAAIQAELQRLFGRRDGVEPPKIRMTRGALAHMYVQGELFTQAISEIRAVLASDPQRMDMKVLLARAYFHNGQRAEAAECCAELLSVSPYCLDANRLMAEILPGTQASEAAEGYRRRVVELDPYAEYVKGSVFATDSVPDASVTLQRLEYHGGPPEVGGAKAPSLATVVHAGDSGQAPPSWLSRGSDPAARTSSPEQQERDLPDFLRGSGWREVPPGTEESTTMESASPDETAGEPEAIPGELPEWVRALAPNEDQLRDVPSTVQASAGDHSMPASSASATPARAPDGVGSRDTPDWLRELAQDAETTEAAAQPTANTRAASQPPSDRSPAVPAGATDDGLAWLEGLAAKHGAKPEELITAPESRTLNPPDWTESLDREESGAPEGWTPVAEGQGEPEPTQTSTADEIPSVVASPSMDWLHGLADADAFVGIEQPSEKDLAPFSVDGTAATSPAVGVDATLPEWLSSPSEERPAPPAAISREPSEAHVSGAELPDWLADLDGARQATAPESAATAPPAPTWVEPAVEQPASGVGVAQWRPVAAEKVPAEVPPLPQARQEVTKLRPEGSPMVEATIPAPPPRAPRSRPAPQTPAGEAVSLGTAKLELGRGNIAAALGMYEKLIRKGKSLQDIIRELRDALYRYPVEVPLWQALGDAYMRANQLQEALDAYTKAEELLR